uniref:Apple domain-containing protein n=1 Tax=Macrostomum lignano TaxID=282301 RepID=A0A1I8H7W8_9PLAT
MILKFVIHCILVGAAMAQALDGAEYSTDPVESLNSTAPITSAGGSSDIHCTVQCSAAGADVCAATAYVEETRVCLFSGVSNADFSAAAPRSTVFRRVKGSQL